MAAQIEVKNAWPCAPPSALTGNDPALLVKSDPPFSTNCTKIVQFGARQMGLQASVAAGEINWFEKKKRVTRGGRRGPGGRPVLALRQIVFLGWVTLSQHKWVNSRERRGRAPSNFGRRIPPKDQHLHRFRDERAPDQSERLLMGHLVGNPSTPNTPNSTPPIAHTVISKIMASALIASIDATQEAERYAHSKGFELEFGADDIRAIAATIFITASKQAPYPADTPNAGGATWRQ